MRRYTALAIWWMLGCGGQTATPAAPQAVNATPSTTAAPSPSQQLSAAASTGMSSAADPVATAPALVSAPPLGSSAPSVKLATIRGKVTTQPAQSAQHAVIYLENGAMDAVMNAKLDDHKMTFYPYVSVMTVGGTLTYVNSEPFPDTAFSLSNEKWDFGLVESKGVRKKKFETAGIYTILCRLHPNQIAFLVVAPSSFVVRTDKTGEFVMPNVPPGSYDVVAWAPRVKSEHKSVTLTDGESTVDFELKR